MQNTHSITLLSLLTLGMLFLTSCQYENVVPLEERDAIQANTPVYTMPAEEHQHEGTWLQWPHDYGWDQNHVSRYESSWVEMTRALHTGEMVHLVMYNKSEKDRVEALLIAEGMDMNQIDFFIWLEGVKGQDITDDHIDGTARFANGNTIVTFYPADSDPDEYQILSTAVNTQGEPFQIVHLPLTQNNVPGTGDKGIYTNFYVGNTVVLVPQYGDPSDAEAKATLQELYPGRTVVGIESAELAADGGMVHCVTQQQPVE